MTTATAPGWSATTAYTAGMEVEIDGVFYVANWWTSGDNPASNNGAIGTGQPWTVVASSSTSGTGTTPVPVPTTPENLTVATTTSSTATLNWSASAVSGSGAVTSYAIFENGTQVGTVSGTATSYTATGLTAATAYAFTVQAIDSSGASAASTAVTATTQVAPVPDAPTALSASSLTSTSFVLSWAAPATPAGATIASYTILYNGKAIGSSTTTSFTLAGLTASTSYTLTVEANDVSGASIASTALTVKTAAATTTPPDYSKVAAWTATTVYTGGQDVVENNIVYAANYWTQGNDPAANSGFAGSAWTAISKVDNTPSAPNAPTGLTATVLSSTRVALLWNPATVTKYGAVSGYAIYENGKQIGVTSNTYYNVDHLAASTAYSFTVAAIDVTGSSPVATVATATTLATGQSLASNAVFAPYYDMGLYGSDDLVAVSQASGIKTFTLAFIQSSGANSIGWSGTGTIAGATTPDGSGTTILSQIKAFQAIGGNVIISFGGENGTDPAAVTGATVASLRAEYQSVIDTYGVTELDFDIEGGQVADTASIALRSAALAALEKANPNLKVSFTLPVLPTGLDANGLNVVKAAIAAGVKLSIVNIMTMDFGGSFDTGASMGTMTIEAIKATEAQLTSLGMNAQIGVTPLIGINDDSAEVFTLADAQQVADYVATDPRVGRVAFWSVARDNNSGSAYPSATSSGVVETNYQYASILEQTTAAVAPGTPALSAPTIPIGLTATTTTSSSTILTWTAASVSGGTVTGYNIYKNGTLLTTVTGTSYTATGLSASTAYRFTVAAIDSAGSSAQSAALSVTTPAGIIPSAPTGLTVATVTGTSLVLSWTPPSTPAGATLSGYTILNNGTVIGTTTGTSFTVTGLSASTKYSLTVEASDQYGISSASTALAVTTAASTLVPPAPAGLTETSLTSSAVALTWTQPSVPSGTTITGYHVYENGTLLTTVTGTSYTATGLSASTTYKFTVAAVDSAGSSAQSSALAVTTPAGQVPTAPSGLTDTSLTSTSVALAWTAPSTPAGATLSGYTILSNGTVVGTTTGTSFTVTGLTAATAYSLTVEASDQYGPSKPSPVLSVTTQAASSAGSGTVPAWSATAVYTAGQTVQENGLIYQAGWWTQDNNPQSNSGAAGSGQVWTVIGKVDTTPTVPDAPTGLTAAAASSSTIDLYWTSATVQGSGTVSGYDVFENGKLVATTTDTYANLGGLTASTAYQFSVEAIDATGVSAPSGTVAATTLAAGATLSTTTFSPYVDMSLYGTPSLVAIAAASGVKNLTLAFIQSSGNGTIGWAGTGTIASDSLPNGATIQSEIKALQAEGGSVTISFGGASGIDPAVAAATNGLTAAQLQAEYQSVITRYGVSSLDFDIEGAAETNTAANVLRDAAVKGLEAANPGLTISYTLPVLPTGLDSNGLAVVHQAATDGVSIDVINIMAMDYGSAVDNGGAMGTDAILAIKATETQLTMAGLIAKIGVTPMIGVNDTSSEVFTLADAQKLADYAATDPDIARIAMWSMGRDNGSNAGAAYASPTGSGLTQTNYEFSSILQHA